MKEQGFLMAMFRNIYERVTCKEGSPWMFRTECKIKWLCLIMSIPIIVYRSSFLAHFCMGIHILRWRTHFSFYEHSKNCSCFCKLWPNANMHISSNICMLLLHTNWANEVSWFANTVLNCHCHAKEHLGSAPIYRHTARTGNRCTKNPPLYADCYCMAEFLLGNSVRRWPRIERMVLWLFSVWPDYNQWYCSAFYFAFSD